VKKTIILSIIIMCISIILGKLMNNWMLTIEISVIIGLVSFVIAGILNGAFISGDRLRANSSIDKEGDKVVRSKITNFVLIIGSLNFILAVIIFFIITKS